MHGSDDTGTYVIAANHGECTSFIAENSKQPQGDYPVGYRGRYQLRLDEAVGISR